MCRVCDGYDGHGKLPCGPDQLPGAGVGRKRDNLEPVGMLPADIERLGADGAGAPPKWQRVDGAHPQQTRNMLRREKQWGLEIIECLRSQA